MSRGATVGLNSSEAWFIYLTFRYRDWGALLHFVLTAKRGRESHCRGLTTTLLRGLAEPVRVTVEAVRVLLEAVRVIK